MKKRNSFPLLVGGTLTVATLATLMVPEGWLIWIPILLALAVVARISSRTTG